MLPVRCPFEWTARRRQRRDRLPFIEAHRGKHSHRLGVCQCRSHTKRCRSRHAWWFRIRGYGSLSLSLFLPRSLSLSLSRVNPNIRTYILIHTHTHTHTHIGLSQVWRHPGLTLAVVGSRPRTTRSAPHIYRNMSGDGFQYHLSQLTFSDEWYCPQSCGPEDAGSTPGLSHSHRRVLTLADQVSPRTMLQQPCLKILG